MPLPQNSPSSVWTTRTWFYSINPAGPQVMSIIDEVSPLIFFLRISFKKSCRQQMPKTLFLTINLGQAIRRNVGMIDRWLVRRQSVCTKNRQKKNKQTHKPPKTK